MQLIGILQLMASLAAEPASDTLHNTAALEGVVTGANTASRQKHCVDKPGACAVPAACWRHTTWSPPLI